MEKLKELLEKAQELFESLKGKKLDSEYTVLLGVGILGAVLDIFLSVDVNDGFIVVLTGLVLKLVKAIQERGK